MTESLHVKREIALTAGTITNNDKRTYASIAYMGFEPVTPVCDRLTTMCAQNSVSLPLGSVVCCCYYYYYYYYYY
jgi:hypothetical protein